MLYTLSVIWLKRLIVWLGFMVLFSNAPCVWAQDPIPDTLDWRRYFPLEVGNEWQYEEREAVNMPPAIYRTFRIVGDTLIEGRTYFVSERGAYDPNTQEFNIGVEFLRYDTTRASIVRFVTYADGSGMTDEWDWSVVPCGLDLAFESGEECGYPGTYHFYAIGGYGRQIVIDSLVYDVAAYKEFDSLGGGYGLAADVGLIWRSSEGGGALLKLVYAKVGEMTYGSPSVPTRREEQNTVPNDVVISSVYPNPLVEQATVAYSTERTGVVELMLYDMLGRLVWRKEIGMQPAGEHLAHINSAGLATGNYILRLSLAKRSFSVIPLLLTP